MNLKGNVLYQTKQYKQALEYYSKALELKKSDQVYNNRGNTYKALGEHENALKDLNVAIELNDSDFFLLENRAQILK